MREVPLTSIHTFTSYLLNSSNPQRVCHLPSYKTSFVTQWNLLRQPRQNLKHDVSETDSAPIFRGITLKRGEIQSPKHLKFLHLDSSVCPRIFHCILSSVKLQEIQVCTYCWVLWSCQIAQGHISKTNVFASLSDHLVPLHYVPVSKDYGTYPKNHMSKCGKTVPLHARVTQSQSHYFVVIHCVCMLYNVIHI